MKTIQQKGFLTYDHFGAPITYDDVDWDRVMRKGLTYDGVPCVGFCIPFAMNANNHYCVPKGKVNEWERCALPGRDQYGRWCEEVHKDKGYGTWCYVKDRNSYNAFIGGTWGYTHPALCFNTTQSCYYDGV
ncbi:hypothetical protein [Singapore grouper iridovirus]|nr:hypothetical protein [Singapore grouper iridovirus]